MSLQFLDRYQGPARYLGLGLFLLLGLFGWLAYQSSSGANMQGFRNQQIIGTLLMLSIIPAFLMASLVFLYRETLQTLEQLAQHSPPDATRRLEHRVTHLPAASFLVILLATCYGAWQNSNIIQGLLTGLAFTAADIALLVGNCLLWLCVGIVMGWRLPASVELQRFGRSLQIDLYAPERVRPLANLATKDVLVVAGALAFMPLQALDAEFRWVNYSAGIYVGIPSALFLLCLPLLGIRQNIRHQKQQRLQEITAVIATTDRKDIHQLEILSAHADRIRAISDWPFDLRLITRILGYSIIAPGAWVGAALVENLVDQFTG